MKKYISIALFCCLMLMLTIPTSAYISDEYALQIGDINSWGEFENITFWERANKMQYFVTPSYQYYYDDVLGELSPQLSYTPIMIPEYITNAMTLPDIDLDDYGNLNSVFNLWWYKYGEDQANITNGTLNVKTLESSGAYSGQTTYTVTSNVAETIQSGEKILMIGELYSFDFTETNNSTTNNVKIDGLSIANPASSGGAVIVYFKGKVEWVDTSLNHGNTGTYDVNKYYLINPGEIFKVNEKLVEGNTGDMNPTMTKYSGSIMVRYGDTANLPVIFVEQYNNYFSNTYTYNDSNLVGMESGTSLPYGGNDITTFFAQRMYNNTSGGATPSYPDYGNLTITDNGVYNSKYYSTVTVNVPQNVTWAGMFDWIIDSAGSFMTFEIAPDWSIGSIMAIAVGLAVVCWALRLFLGG